MVLHPHEVIQNPDLMALSDEDTLSARNQLAEAVGKLVIVAKKEVSSLMTKRQRKTEVLTPKEEGILFFQYMLCPYVLIKHEKAGKGDAPNPGSIDDLLIADGLNAKWTHNEGMERENKDKKGKKYYQKYTVPTKDVAEEFKKCVQTTLPGKEIWYKPKLSSRSWSKL